MINQYTVLKQTNSELAMIKDKMDDEVKAPYLDHANKLIEMTYESSVDAKELVTYIDEDLSVEDYVTNQVFSSLADIQLVAHNQEDKEGKETDILIALSQDIAAAKKLLLYEGYYYEAFLLIDSLVDDGIAEDVEEAKRIYFSSLANIVLSSMKVSIGDSENFRHCCFEYECCTGKLVYIYLSFSKAEDAAFCFFGNPDTDDFDTFFKDAATASEEIYGGGEN